jgi:predicted PurR-regulated permease PerM
VLETWAYGSAEATDEPVFGILHIEEGKLNLAADTTAAVLLETKEETVTSANDSYYFKAALIKDWLQANQEQIEHFLKSKDFSDAIKTTMPKVFSVVSQTATVLMSIVASMITLLYMFFILLDYETLTANWVRIFPKKNRPFWSALMKDVERELNNYIRGQGLVALCMGIMFCIGFTIILTLKIVLH